MFQFRIFERNLLQYCFTVRMITIKKYNRKYISWKEIILQQWSNNIKNIFKNISSDYFWEVKVCIFKYVLVAIDNRTNAEFSTHLCKRLFLGDISILGCFLATRLSLILLTKADRPEGPLFLLEKEDKRGKEISNWQTHHVIILFILRRQF